jgi:LPPG:FO 2-phospho-L-lactate transferase
MSRDLVVALSGGIGGAKLALGLSHVVAPGNLLVVANTGDDFEHLGLSISPDIDTLVYTLAGLDNTELGWGRRDESWNFMAALEAIGGATWFRLGDRDLAMHVERTRRLAAGETLAAITDDLSRRLGVGPCILPMSDDPVRTMVRAGEGWIAFQDYFVRQQCRPVVKELAFRGAEAARAHPDFLAALASPRLRAVVVCPSNPLISVGPILAVPGVRDAIAACAAPVVAVSPIIGGRAVKGPTAKMFAELGTEPSAASVARHYAGLLRGYVLDHEDAGTAGTLGLPCRVTQTLMKTLDDKVALARDVLGFADRLGA